MRYAPITIQAIESINRLITKTIKLNGCYQAILRKYNVFRKSNLVHSLRPYGESLLNRKHVERYYKDVVTHLHMPKSQTKQSKVHSRALIFVRDTRINEISYTNYIISPIEPIFSSHNLINIPQAISNFISQQHVHRHIYILMYMVVQKCYFQK